MKQLSLRNNRLEFKTAGKLPIILEVFIEYAITKENRKMSTCNRLDLGILGYRLVIMPKNLPGHRSGVHVN